MISAANQKAIEARAGCRSSSGTKIPDIPYVVAAVATRAPRRAAARWADPDPALAGRAPRSAPRPGHLLPIPRRPGPAHPARDRRAGRQGRARGRRGRRRSSATGSSRLHRRRQEREPHPGGQGAGPGRVEGLHHQPHYLPRRHPRHRRVRHRRLPPAVAQIEASFRMSKHDLAARPIYHHKRESIDAHLSVVFAALAVGRCDRGAHRMVDPPLRAHRPPLPHRADPRRPAAHHGC